MRSRFGKSLVFRTFPKIRQGHGTQRWRHTTRENKLAPRSLLMLTGHYQITWTQREAMPKPCAVSSVVDAAIDQFSLPTFLACLFIAGPFFFSFSQFLAFLLVLAALSSPGLLATATFLGALWPRAPVAVCGCWSSEESLVSVRTASSQSGPWGVRVIDEYSPEIADYLLQRNSSSCTSSFRCLHQDRSSPSRRVRAGGWYKFGTSFEYCFSHT